MVSLNGVCVTQKNGGLPTWSVCQGCHRKLPQTGDTGWLKQQKLVLSQHCRLEVRGQGVCRIVPSEASLLAWQVVVVSLCLPHGLPSICSVQFRSVAQSCPTLCEPMNRSQASLSITNSRSLLKLMSIESVMPLHLCPNFLFLQGPTYIRLSPPHFNFITSLKALFKCNHILRY